MKLEEALKASRVEHKLDGLFTNAKAIIRISDDECILSWGASIFNQTENTIINYEALDPKLEAMYRHSDKWQPD